MPTDSDDKVLSFPHSQATALGGLLHLGSRNVQLGEFECMYSSIRPCIGDLKWILLEPPVQHQSEDNKRANLKFSKTAIGQDIVEQSCRYTVEFIEDRTHDIMLSSLASMSSSISRELSAENQSLDTEESLYHSMVVFSSLNNLSDAECRSCDRMTAVKDPNVENLEAVGRSLKLFAHLYWRLNYSQMGRGIRVFRTQEDVSKKYISDSEYENRGFTSRDIFQVLHLWQNNIACRGISAGNVMDANENIVCGALCDWDLAKVSSESNFRPGTRAFLAMDLLDAAPPPHIERFDWESVLYLLIWITTRYEDEKEKDTGALAQWFNHKDTIAFSAKLVYIYHFDKRPEPKAFKLLHRYWIHPWTVLFRSGFQARSDSRVSQKTTSASERLDDETLGGYVTYEKLWAYMKQDFVEDDH